MDSEKKKSILTGTGIFTVAVAFIAFWSADKKACADHTEQMNDRIQLLEKESRGFISLKNQSDIFALKLEYELNRKETRLNIIEAYLDALPIPAWIKRQRDDGEFEMIMVNQAYVSAYGKSKALYKGRTDAQVWPENMAKIFKVSDDAIIESKGVLRTIQNISDKDGEKQVVVWKFFIELKSINSIGVGGIVVCDK